MADPLRLPRDPTSEARELHKVHPQAVKALEHAIDFGDWTGITGLVNAFYNQRRGEQLTCWFGAFGTFSLTKGRLAFFPSTANLHACSFFSVADAIF
jgi:hypothetical protein